MVWCDGRRSADLRAGLQIEVQQGRHRLLLARLSEAPFTDRLVNKFGLRVEGWRGEAEERVSREDRTSRSGRREPGRRRRRVPSTRAAGEHVIEELRIRDLGVISDAVVGPHPGLTVVTGETGAGKTMIVTGLGLLLGDRADARSVRSGTERARGRGTAPGPGRTRRPGWPSGSATPAATWTTTSWWWPGTSPRPGRSRAFLGGAQVPVSVCAEVTTELVAIHGQSEQVRLAARRAGSASCWTRTPVPTLAAALAEYRRALGRAPGGPGRAGRARRRRAPSGPARSSCCASGWSRSSGWPPSRGRTSRWRPSRSGCRTPTTSGSPSAAPWPGCRGTPTTRPGAVAPRARWRPPGAAWTTASGDPALEALAAPAWPRRPTWSPTSASDLARYLDDLVADPARLEWVVRATGRSWPVSPARTGRPSTTRWPGRRAGGRPG